ncbi:hypothetical protein GRI39_02090 [Altererythrobacter indicus]|uniref:Uncharacterized protein n=1 Tax=Altericroceibacterium indicum TaxID=374177 RepID=A0A845A5J8_9SPHN|nr:hypothetical protein [Altericroceibacterium indicum]MXP24837.1 hypothetical protein [Altericroceibacterium indicum]
MAESNVVQQISQCSEEQFHACMMEAVIRQIRRHGKDTVARTMSLSKRQLDNLSHGSFPRPDRLWSLLALDTDALDPIDRAFGQRRVPREATCSTDPFSSKVAVMLSKLIEMEHPGSDGGSEITTAELLGLDKSELRTMRIVVNRFAGLLEKLDAYREGKPPHFTVHQSEAA